MTCATLSFPPSDLPSDLRFSTLLPKTISLRPRAQPIQDPSVKGGL